jgi:hypothetical protein
LKSQARPLAPHRSARDQMAVQDRLDDVLQSHVKKNRRFLGLDGVDIVAHELCGRNRIGLHDTVRQELLGKIRGMIAQGSHATLPSAAQ